jgi:hypothetical protein|tara:strand:+ start:3627 stop:3836 length:210 start_codon:yes stop_codon:yes gene_type:complete
MGKKKKFGFSDALEIAQGAASVYAAFNSGNSTNLAGSEGGKTPKLKAKTSKNIDQSPLAKEYNRKNFMQ